MAEESQQKPSGEAHPTAPPSAHMNHPNLHNFINEAIEATNPSLRHLASHSSLGSQLSRHRSRGSRADSDVRSGTTRRSVRPLSTNFEEQRHPGKSALSITSTTKPFEPNVKEESDLKAIPEWRGHRSSVGAGSNQAFGSDDITLYSDVRTSQWSDKKAETSGPGTSKKGNNQEERPLAQEHVGEEEDETNYPGPLGLFILITGIALSVFLISLDRTIITTVCSLIYFLKLRI